MSRESWPRRWSPSKVPPKVVGGQPAAPQHCGTVRSGQWASVGDSASGVGQTCRRKPDGWLHCSCRSRDVRAPHGIKRTRRTTTLTVRHVVGVAVLIARWVERVAGGRVEERTFLLLRVLRPFRATSFIRWLCDYRCYFLPVFSKNEPNCERRRPPDRRTEHEKRPARGHSAVGFGKLYFRVRTYRRCEWRRRETSLSAEHLTAAILS